MSKTLQRIPAEILDRAVDGIGLVPGRLRDQLDQRGTLCVFLRHLG